MFRQQANNHKTGEIQLDTAHCRASGPRKTVSLEKPLVVQPSVDETAQCHDGVCEVTWKPSRPAA
jgi:hypothetical protein